MPRRCVTAMEVGLLLLAGGVAAGAFGSLLGLGGGLLIVPLLTIGFGLPLREAVGVSLVCVIVTSSASAGVYLQRRRRTSASGWCSSCSPGSARSSAGDRVPRRRAPARRPVHGDPLLHGVSMLRAPDARPAPTPDEAAAMATRRGNRRRAGRRCAHRRSRRGHAGPSTGRACRMPLAAVASVGAGVASAARDRRRPRQGAADAPHARRPAPDRDGHQQPHGRDHRVHERHRLPAPGRIDAYAPAPPSACSSGRASGRGSATSTCRTSGCCSSRCCSTRPSRWAAGPWACDGGPHRRAPPARRPRPARGRAGARPPARDVRLGRADRDRCAPAPGGRGSRRSGRPTAGPRDPPRRHPGAAAPGFLWLGILGVLATPALRVARALLGFCAPGRAADGPVSGLVLAVIAVGVIVGVMAR